MLIEIKIALILFHPFDKYIVYWYIESVSELDQP